MEEFFSSMKPLSLFVEKNYQLHLEMAEDGSSHY